MTDTNYIPALLMIFLFIDINLFQKYKSMQTTDLEDDLRRIEEKMQKKKNRKPTGPGTLLQGVATPYHPHAHVLVQDTQPRSPVSKVCLCRAIGPIEIGSDFYVV